jgi:hypothetical protein
MRNPSIIHRRFGVIHRSASNGNSARMRGQRQGVVGPKAVQSIDNPSTELRKPSTDVLPNLLIIYRFSPAIYRFSRRFSMKQRPRNDRRNHRIERFGRRNRSVESSRNHQIAPLLGWRRGSPNRKVIVNRFAVIVNSAAWNLSPIHHQNAEIYHRAGRPPAIRLLESSDNHPTKGRNHPTESANLPIIYRRMSVTGDKYGRRK